MSCFALAAVFAQCASTWKEVPAATANKERSLHDEPWRFVDEHGESVSFAQYRGTPLVVTAVYTNCDKTCPMTIARLREIHEEGVRTEKPEQILLITLDPEHDTPATLAAYKKQLDLPESWHLWRGAPEVTNAVAERIDMHLLDVDAHLFHEAKIARFDATGRRRQDLQVR